MDEKSKGLEEGRNEMYKKDEEITNEVIFTRLLRALDCYDDEDVFFMEEHTSCESEELKFPENASADYIRYCEVENLMYFVSKIREEQFKLVDSTGNYDIETGEGWIDDEYPLFPNPAICIYSQYQNMMFIGDATFELDLEVWMTDKFDFYTVENSFVECDGRKNVYRRILSTASEDRDIGIPIDDLIMGVQDAYKDKNTDED